MANKPGTFTKIPREEAMEHILQTKPSGWFKVNGYKMQNFKSYRDGQRLMEIGSVERLARILNWSTADLVY